MYEKFSKLSYNIRGIYFVPLNVNYSNILHIIKKDEVTQSKNKGTINFKIVKHSKPEIFELYLRNNEGYYKVDYAYIQTIEHSKMVNDLFKFDDNVVVECEYIEKFKKWKPIKKTDNMIDHIKDFELHKSVLI